MESDGFGYANGNMNKTDLTQIIYEQIANIGGCGAVNRILRPFGTVEPCFGS